MKSKNSGAKDRRDIVGITALVPPELMFGCGAEPCDINNFVPQSGASPRNKLCAWTAAWREMVLDGKIKLDKLVVVAGGDCHNTLVDGQKIALSGVPTHFFFYPFDGDSKYLSGQLGSLSEFLGNSAPSEKTFREIALLKKKGLELDKLRAAGKLPSEGVFKLMISFSDMGGSVEGFGAKIDKLVNKAKSNGKFPKSQKNGATNPRIALIGVPPIYCDFHASAEALGLSIVFDELPYEFTRLSGRNMREIAKNYATYTFAREIRFRINFLRNELERRKIDGIIHYTQYACHHTLEDEIFRREFDYPMLTIQGDLPGNTPEQLKLRLEAFREMLGRKG